MPMHIKHWAAICNVWKSEDYKSIRIDVLFMMLLEEQKLTKTNPTIGILKTLTTILPLNCFLAIESESGQGSHDFNSS